MAGRNRDPDLDGAILDAARDIVRTDGYRAASIATIARRASVPRSTVYRRWSSAFELLDAAFAAMLPAAVPVSAPRERLLALLDDDVAFARSADGRALAHVLLDAGPDPAVMRSVERLGQRRRQYVAVLMDLAEPGAPISVPESAASVALDLVWGSAVVDRDRPAVHRLADAVLAMVQRTP